MKKSEITKSKPQKKLIKYTKTNFLKKPKISFKMTYEKRRILEDSKNIDEYINKYVKLKPQPWRHQFLDNCILKFFLLNRREKKKFQKRENAIKIWSRRSTIPPYLIDCYVRIHNGRHFVTKKINPEMVGHKFGQFSFTRQIYMYKKKKKK